MNNLKALKAFKDANVAYQAGDFKKAADRYETCLQLAPENPQIAAAYFFLGNSYDNQWKPSRVGEAENDGYLTKAIEYYKKAADRTDTEAIIRRRALEYLVAAYGSDKLNRPDEAAPIVQKMIQMDPNDPSYYFALGKIYEDAGRYDEAEAMYLKAKEVKPNDPLVYRTLAGYYNRQGDFAKTIKAFEEGATKDTQNPEAFHYIGGFYEEKARKDFRLSDAQKKDMVARGIAAEDRALALKGDYIEALTIKNILLRVQANWEKDPVKQKQLLRDADILRNKANELIKKRTAGIG
jgi:tetratricopeptide (TPR) repeat protein